MRVIAEHDDQVDDARLQHEEDDQRQQQRRDRVQDVGEPQQDVVGPAAEITGDEADHVAEQRRDADREEGDRHATSARR